MSRKIHQNRGREKNRAIQEKKRKELRGENNKGSRNRIRGTSGTEKFKGKGKGVGHSEEGAE